MAANEILYMFLILFSCFISLFEFLGAVVSLGIMSSEQKGSDSGSSSDEELTATEIAENDKKNRAASDAALNTATLPGDALMASFHGLHPVDGGKFFQHQDSIEITPGIGPLSSYLVKVDWRSLGKGNIIVLLNGGPLVEFKDLIAAGIFQVIEDSPIQFEYIETLPGQIANVPNFITLHDTKSVFAWNERGVAMIDKSVLDRFPRPVRNMQTDPRRLVTFTGGPTLGTGTVPPPVPLGRVESFKALQNADRTRPLKTLLRHDEALITKFAPLDDVTAFKGRQAIQAVLKQSQLSFIAFKTANIPAFLSMQWQRSSEISKDKQVTGVHFTHFRESTAEVTTHDEITKCVQSAVRIIRQLNGDPNHVIQDSFSQLLAAVADSDTGSLSTLDPKVVIDAISDIFVKFGMALSSEEGFGATDTQLVALLRREMRLDMVAIRLRDDEQFKFNARSQSGKRKYVEDATNRKKHDKSGGGSSGSSGGGGGGSRGTNYCLNNVCHKFLGGNLFDGQSKPVTKCQGEGKGCRYEHNIPSKPVQKDELKDLVRATANININAPEKKKALLSVLNAPGFSV